jgi:dihydrofolate reductase
MKKFAIVVAVDQKNGIGKDNALPWHLPSEMKHFSKLTKTTSDPTKKNAVIMGRNTWESIPQKFRPLPNRYNVVLTSNAEFQVPDGVLLASSLDEALNKLTAIPEIENIFVIGGASVYKQAIFHPACEKISITKIEQSFDCDTFFPHLDEQLFDFISSSEAHQENNLMYRYCLYQRKNPHKTDLQ